MEQNLLKVFVPKTITDRSIDSAYIDGYVSNEDYRSYYMDPTRRFVPSWISPSTEFSDVKDKCERENVVYRKNTRIHDINMTTNLLGL